MQRSLPTIHPDTTVEQLDQFCRKTLAHLINKVDQTYWSLVQAGQHREAGDWFTLNWRLCASHKKKSVAA